MKRRRRTEKEKAIEVMAELMLASMPVHGPFCPVCPEAERCPMRWAN